MARFLYYLFFFAIPKVFFQIYMLRVAEGHALGFQQRTLLGPAGNQPPRMVDDTVTGIVAVVFRVA